MTLLVDYDASRGDEVSKLGILNLEAARGDNQSNNTADLYIKKDKDPEGKAAAHCHRKQGDIRAEYHALKDQMKAGTTYYFAYSFAVNKVQDNLMIMQLKEYEANAHGGANIPLSFEINSNGALEFQHQPSGDQGRQVQWTKALEPNKTYKIGLEILAKASGGHAKLWWNGNPATFTTTKTDTITGNMFPGNSSPKFGAYRGEEVTIDTYIYKVQIGTNKADLDASFF